VNTTGEKPTTKVRSKASGGLGDIYIIISDIENSPEDLIQKYHNHIVGNPVLIPQWSLGWHQCYWGYETTDWLRWNVNNYTKYDLPLDT
jgi:alpha-glucosidase